MRSLQKMPLIKIIYLYIHRVNLNITDFKKIFVVNFKLISTDNCSVLNKVNFFIWLQSSLINRIPKPVRTAPSKLGSRDKSKRKPPVVALRRKANTVWCPHLKLKTI